MFPVPLYIYPADVGRPGDRVCSGRIAKMYYICDTFEGREKEVSFYCATVISFKDLPADETCSWHFMWDLSPAVFMRKKHALPTIWPDDKILIKRSAEVKEKKSFASLRDGEPRFRGKRWRNFFFSQTGKVKVRCVSGSIGVKSRLSNLQNVSSTQTRGRVPISARDAKKLVSLTFTIFFWICKSTVPRK